MDLRLRGKRALVTGSSRGIGRAIALSLADFKVDVAINFFRHRAPAEAVVKEIEARGARALLVQGQRGGRGARLRACSTRSRRPGVASRSWFRTRPRAFSSRSPS